MSRSAIASALAASASMVTASANQPQAAASVDDSADTTLAPNTVAQTKTQQRNKRKRSAKEVKKADAARVKLAQSDSLSALPAHSPSRAKRARATSSARTVQQEIDERHFWARFSTPLLVTWANNTVPTAIPSAKELDREFVLTYLVTTPVMVPVNCTTTAAALAELQATWRGFYPKAVGPMPGEHVADISAIGASSATRISDDAGLFDDGDVDDDDAADDDDEEFDSDGDGAAFLAAASASAAAAIKQDEKRQAKEANIRGATKQVAQYSLAIDSMRTPSTFFPVPQHVQWCLTCAAAKPPGALLAWRCIAEDCQLRGDLPVDSAVNMHLAATRSHHAAAASPSAIQGQQTDDSKPTLTRLQRELVRLHSIGVDMPQFAAALPYSVEEAFADGRRAIHAPMMAPPLPQLITLIQGGRFVDVGYAIPLPLQTSRSDIESPLDAFTVSATLGIAPTKSVTAPLLSSLTDFFFAMVATILPALTGRPAAQSMWLSLARTVISLEMKHGWPYARAYMESLLYERTAIGGSFSKVSGDILNGLNQSLASGMIPHRAAVGHANAHAGSGAAPAGKCIDFNFNTCPRTPCRYAHVCWYGCSAPHKGKECVKDSAAGRPHRDRSSSNNSNNRSRGGRGGARGGASNGRSSATPAAPSASPA